MRELLLEWFPLCIFSALNNQSKIKVMANMSYCRFENTYRDLVDCYTNMEGELSGSEHKYRERLITLCKDIVDAYDGVEFEVEEEND